MTSDLKKKIEIHPMLRQLQVCKLFNWSRATHAQHLNFKNKIESRPQQIW